MILGACLGEGSLSATDHLLQQLVDAIMKDANNDNNNMLTFGEFHAQFKKCPDLKQALDIR